MRCGLRDSLILKRIEKKMTDFISKYSKFIQRVLTLITYDTYSREKVVTQYLLFLYGIF